MVSTTHPTPVPEEASGKGDVKELKSEGFSEETTKNSDALFPLNKPTPEPVQPIKEESPLKEESKNWLDLPMLVKLDSMHLLTEWQFQNPTRLRTIMKSDDETATWVRPLSFIPHSDSDDLCRGLSRLDMTQKAMPTGSLAVCRDPPVFFFCLKHDYHQLTDFGFNAYLPNHPKVASESGLLQRKLVDAKPNALRRNQLQK